MNIYFFLRHRRTQLFMALTDRQHFGVSIVFALLFCAETRFRIASDASLFSCPLPAQNGVLVATLKRFRDPSGGIIMRIILESAVNYERYSIIVIIMYKYGVVSSNGVANHCVRRNVRRILPFRGVYPCLLLDN